MGMTSFIQPWFIEPCACILLRTNQCSVLRAPEKHGSIWHEAGGQSVGFPSHQQIMTVRTSRLFQDGLISDLQKRIPLTFYESCFKDSSVNTSLSRIVHVMSG